MLGAFTSANELAGFVKFVRDQRSKARHKAMLHAMYVHSDYRGQGVGRILIDTLFEQVQQLKGLEQIHLWTLHAETSAASFYSLCGFQSQGVVKKDLKIAGRYVDAEYMVYYFS